MKATVTAALALAGLLSVNSAGAEQVKHGDLMIDSPWARASIGQAKAGAAYVTLYNHGSEADRLVAAESDIAKRTEIHTMEMVEGVMKMRPLKAIEVAPGEPSILQPGGMHIMFMGLKAPLVEQETFPVTLTFEKAGKIEIEVSIQSATALEADDRSSREGHSGQGGHSGHGDQSGQEDPDS